MPGGSPITVRLQHLYDDVNLSGTAQGDILYHGASKWNNLAAGTAGNLLATGGAGANPSWATNLTYSGANSGTALTVQAATSGVGLTIKAAGTTPGNIANFTDSSGTVLSAINSSGALTKTTLSGNTNTVYVDFKRQDGLSCWKITEAGGLSGGAVTTLIAQAQATLSTSNGSITIATGGNTNPSNYVSIVSPSLRATNTLASAIGLIVKGAASQSANLQEWQNSSGTVLANVTAAGVIKTDTISGITGSGEMTIASATSQNLTLTATSGTATLNRAGGANIAVGTTIKLDNGTVTIGGNTFSMDNPDSVAGRCNWTTSVCAIWPVATGDVAFFGSGSFGSGSKVIFIGNATTAPTTDPTGGGILYCEGGALKYRGSSGTVTTLGAA